MKNLLVITFLSLVLTSCKGAITPDTAPTTTPAQINSTETPNPNNLTASPTAAVNYAELGRLGKGVIKQTLWSPDGKTIAVATSVGIYLYDSQTLSELVYIDTKTQVTSISFTPDSQRVAAGDDYPNKTIRLWEVASGNLVKTFSGSAYVNSISINSNSILASGASGGEIRLWNIQSGETINTLNADGRNVENVAFSKDGTLLASGSRDGIIRLWDSAGNLLNTFYSPGEFAVMAVALSPDNLYLASGGNDGKVTLWNVDSGETLFSKDSDVTLGLTFSPDGKTLASANYDNAVRIWNVPTGELVKTIQEHSNHVTTVSFSPDGNYLISGSNDGTIKLWDSSTGNSAGIISGFFYYFQDIALSPDGKTLISSVWKNVQQWDLGSLQLKRTIENGIGWQESVAFSSDGHYFASIGCATEDSYGYCQSSTATIWGFDSGQVLRTIDLGENSEEPVKVLFNPDGKYLVTADGDSEKNNLKVWDMFSGQLIRVMDGLYIHDVIFGASGNELISAVFEEIWVRDISTGNLKFKIVLGEYVKKVALSPDGHTLAISRSVGSSNGSIVIWSLQSGTRIKTIVHAKQRTTFPDINSIAFSPDGKLLASGASDGTIYLWDTQSWKIVAIFRHTDIVTKLVFSNGGDLLISSSFDGTIRIWGIKP